MNIAVGDIGVNVSISFVVAHYVKIVALNVFRGGAYARPPLAGPP